MRRAIKCFMVVAAVVALVGASPTMARCLFGAPIVQGIGQDGGPKGNILTGTDGVGSGVRAYFWEVGFGDPAIGAGNDQGTRLDRDGGVDGDVIVRDPNPRVSFNWTNSDVDGCLSGAAAGTGAMAIYVVDDNGDYAVAAVSGSDVGGSGARHDFDKILSGVGPSGADLPLVAPSIAPVLSNVVIVDASSITADVAPAEAGANFYDDGNGPYSPLFDSSAMSGPCPDGSGCSGVTIGRDADLCWSGNLEVAGAAGPATCECAPTNDPNCVFFAQGKTCGPPDGVQLFCDSFFGTCVPGPLVAIGGPSIPGGCVTVGGPVVDDHAVARATKQKGFTVFSWEATQFAVSHWNIIDTTKGDRRVNHDAIARKGDNGGATVSYEFVATGRDVRGGKRFELELVRTDGQRVRFNID